MSSGSLVVFDPGVASTLQDEGRPGFTADAVSPSGAADLPSYRLANRIVGNQPGCAAIELVLGTLRFRADRPTVIAVTGAPLPVTVGGRQRTSGEAIHVSAGDEIEFGWAHRGLRSYVAVRGGINVPLILGSRSTDTMSGLGPPALAVGDRLLIGDATAGLPAPDIVPTHPIEEAPVLEVHPGPRRDWLDEASIRRFGAEQFSVSDQINRIGVRCAGPALVQREVRQLASEAVIVGAVQIPPNGEPIIFGPDHPTTGGYPVVAVVVERQLPAVAQLRPGQTLRFRWLA